MRTNKHHYGKFDWSRWLPTIVCVAAVLCLILFMGNLNPSDPAPTNLPAQVSAPAFGIQSSASSSSSSSTSSNTDSWQNNVMNENGLKPMLKAYDIKPSTIQSVTFLDSLSDAPKSTVYLGTYSSSAVQGWVEWGNEVKLYIAAEGGINAKLCCDDLFRGFNNMEQVNFNGAFHTDDATSMKNMFRDCRSLTEVDVSGFNTSKVESMSCMFSTCIALVDLDLSSFDTSSVTNMNYMFSACTKLETVNVASFDTSKVKDVAGMFRWCNALQSVDCGKWDVSNVTSYQGFMNDGCTVSGSPWEEMFR